MSTPKWKKELRQKEQAEAKRKRNFEKQFGSITASKSSKREFKEYAPAESYRRETPEYPSCSNRIAGYAPRKESPKYTGTLIKGIATMHKSNAVPVINQKQAEEISSMRR
jgi:hypothetical protein